MKTTLKHKTVFHDISVCDTLTGLKKIENFPV